MKSESIKAFLKLKNIAIIGVSRKGEGFGASIYNHLKNNGYTVFAVNRIGGFSIILSCIPHYFKLISKLMVLLLSFHRKRQKILFIRRTISISKISGCSKDLKQKMQLIFVKIMELMWYMENVF